MIGKFLKITSGFAFKSSKFNDEGLGMPLIRIRDVGQSESFTFYDGEYDEAYLIRKGDFLVGMDGEFRLAEWSGPDSLLNQRVCKLESDSKYIDRRYFFHVLPAELKRIEDTTSFVTVKHLSVKKIKEIDIPLPPLSTQKKIADILDAADSHRQKTKQLLAKFDELAQSIFLEMFGDPVTNPKGWDTTSITELVKKDKWSLKRGPFGGALKKEIFVDEGYLVYEQYHALNNDFSFERYYIDKSKFEELKAFEVKPGDIIISCSGVYLGKLAIVPSGSKKGIINQALLKVSLDSNRMSSKFFVFHFSNPRFKETYFDSNRGAGIPNFPPMNVFKEFPFINPPIAFQNKFEKAIESVEKMKDAAKKSEEQTENLFNSLLQKAFKGELGESK